MIVTQFDSTNAGAISRTARAVALYTDGRFANADAASNFPDAITTLITVHGDDRGRIADVESGDLTVDGGVRWLRDRLAAHVPGAGLYGSQSTWDAIGQTEGVRWLANPDRNPAVPPGFHAKQHTWLPSVDISSCLPGYFVPPPFDPLQYDRYPLDPFRFGRLLVSERKTVAEYDRLWPHRRERAERIAVLRSHVKLLRDRCKRVSLYQPPHFVVPRHYADWSDHRGWRWQRLNDRLHGEVRHG